MRSLLWPGLAGLGGLLLTVLAGRVFGAGMDDLTGDIFLITRTAPVAGLLSNLGAFGWFAAALLPAFAAATPAARGAPGLRRFLLCSALLNLYLLIDDFFMIHDFWVRLWLGKVDAAYYALLALVLAAYLAGFRRALRRGNLLSLGLALACFGLSVAMDVVQEAGTRLIGHWQYLAEDGAKWVGICFWVAFFFGLCRAVVAGGGRAAAGDA